MARPNEPDVLAKRAIIDYVFNRPNTDRPPLISGRLNDVISQEARRVVMTYDWLIANLDSLPNS